MKTAFLFPGQGSQQVGMGKDVAANYRVSRDVFTHADDLLGMKLSQICFEGSEDLLNATENTQPALYVTSFAILSALQTEMMITPDCVAGHSLGEFTALALAGVFSFEEGLKLVRERGRLMKEAGEKQPGGMAALLGLDAAPVRELCERASKQVGKQVVVANDNCPGQVVISGDNEALETAMALATESGAKRVVRLAVSIAAHSPLMATASDSFKQLVGQITLSPPKLPVYANVSAKPLANVDSIREELNRQLTQEVRWTETMQAMVADGVERFIEIGSGDVLSGLVKRIDRSKTRISLNSADTIKAFVG
ncbi:MAG: ACP S-malonyltransferase [Aggregatilineales bacterium]